MNNGSGDEWGSVFTAEGAIIRVSDRESAITPYRNPNRELWPECSTASRRRSVRRSRNQRSATKGDSSSPPLHDGGSPVTTAGTPTSATSRAMWFVTARWLSR